MDFYLHNPIGIIAQNVHSASILIVAMPNYNGGVTNYTISVSHIKAVGNLHPQIAQNCSHYTHVLLSTNNSNSSVQEDHFLVVSLHNYNADISNLANSIIKQICFWTSVFSSY